MSKPGHWFTNDRTASAARNDHPAAFNNSTGLSCPQRPSSCIQRLGRPQLPATTIQLHPATRPISAYQHQTSSCISTTRPTPATLIERPAAHNYNYSSTIPANDVTHPSWRPHTTAMDIYIHVCNSGNKIVTFVVSVIPSFCLPSLSLAVTTLARIKPTKIYLRSRRAYRLRNIVILVLT